MKFLLFIFQTVGTSIYIGVDSCIEQSTLNKQNNRLIINNKNNKLINS